LFAAAERVLVRRGPSELTSRAVTDEAGCAKGILHNRFGDFDGFLAAFVISRSELLAGIARRLESMAGQGSPVDNITDTALAIFGSRALSISSLVISRPSLIQHLRDEHTAAGPVLHEIQDAFAAYLEAEKSLTRVAPDADSQTLAFTLFASAHQLFFGRQGEPIERHRMRQVVASLLAGVTVGDR
jgi:AcrR family transcriptional regulator